MSGNHGDSPDLVEKAREIAIRYSGYVNPALSEPIARALPLAPATTGKE